jgi:hypothetical protein
VYIEPSNRDWIAPRRAIFSSAQSDPARQILLHDNQAKCKHMQV